VPVHFHPTNERQREKYIAGLNHSCKVQNPGFFKKPGFWAPAVAQIIYSCYIIDLCSLTRPKYDCHFTPNPTNRSLLPQCGW
jgi:hypothetical protein